MLLCAIVLGNGSVDNSNPLTKSESNPEPIPSAVNKRLKIVPGLKSSMNNFCSNSRLSAVKFKSTSVLLNGEPLRDLSVNVAITFPVDLFV